MKHRFRNVNKSSILRTSPSILRALANTYVQCANKPYEFPERNKGMLAAIVN